MDPAAPSSRCNRSDAPLVSAIVCTRNRGARVCGTLRSILASPHPNFELMVIDQSADDATEHAISRTFSDTRLRYLRSRTRGVSRARNVALAAARSELVIMTDDDCEVPPEWLPSMAGILASHPRVAAVFSDVVPPVRSHSYYLPISVWEGSALVEAVGEWIPADGVNIGIGASMALRRSIVQEIGGFDPLLGAGGRFRSAEDTDITLRLLLRGYAVYRMSDVGVRHYGFRTIAEGRHLIRCALFGVAATCAKLLRCGHWSIIPFFLGILFRMVLLPFLRSITQRRKPVVWGRAVYLARGFSQGWRAPIDRDRQVFAASGSD